MRPSGGPGPRPAIVAIVLSVRSEVRVGGGDSSSQETSESLDLDSKSHIS